MLDWYREKNRSWAENLEKGMEEMQAQDSLKEESELIQSLRLMKSCQLMNGESDAYCQGKDVLLTNQPPLSRFSGLHEMHRITAPPCRKDNEMDTIDYRQT